MAQLSLIAFVGLTLLLTTGDVDAVQKIKSYAVADALALQQSKSKLGSLVKFYFANHPHGEVAQHFAKASTAKKINAFNKSDLEACQSVFLAALIALKDRAKKEGGNAVINIQSQRNGKTSVIADNFDCVLGRYAAAIQLSGDIVTLNQ
ncbi:MAG: hypothetical protein ACI9FJ_001017 [Alteromonadaceae bacterium]|jgi:hypothetical protein